MVGFCFLDISFNLEYNWDAYQIKRALRGVKVEVTHRGNVRRKYRVSGLTSQPTRELVYVLNYLFVFALHILWTWKLVRILAS